jgi:DNA mismatch endonuclease (patch repair protein)
MADNLSPQARSYCMSRVRTRDTDLERAVRSALQRAGLRFRKHVPSLPGKPDLVLPTSRMAIFIDGDFWHGYRFPAWSHKVSAFWRKKIASNRARDVRNFRRLRKMGWRVVRIWQHQIERDMNGCLRTILEAAHSQIRPRAGVARISGRGDPARARVGARTNSGDRDVSSPRAVGDFARRL